MDLSAKCIDKRCRAGKQINCFTGISAVCRTVMNPVFLTVLFGINIYPKSGLGNESIEIVRKVKISSNLIFAKPSVSEPKIVSRGRDSIFIEGNIIADGGSAIKERGIIYGLISEGNEVDKKIVYSGSGEIFNILITGLQQNRAYRVKAYAINQDGLSYGPEKKFDTYGSPVFSTLLNPEVNYDTEYFSIIKTEPGMGQETKISVITKPEWLTLSLEPLARIFAGSETIGSNDGKGSKATFFAPYALASNSKGNIFVADQVNNSIRKISPEGDVSTVAGIKLPGFRDGKGIEARFDTPSGIAVDQEGNLYISDQNNHSIRKISPSGEVITIAGNQKAGAVDGRGGDASFKSPAGICIDNRGFLYIADRGNNLIRVISPEGIVSTLAGCGKAGYADGNGKNAMFNTPTGIVVDGEGYVYVADEVNNRIRKISPAGNVSTFAGNGEFSNRDGEGNKAAFRYPTALVFDKEENLYVADQLNHSIRKISHKGVVSTIKISNAMESNTGGSTSNFKNPSGICFNKDGDILVADYHNHNIKEIICNTLLYGTPSKSQVGTHKVILKASNNIGSTTLEAKLVVKDKVSPKIVSTVPGNLAVDVDRTTKLIISFDEEVSPVDSGSIKIFRENELIRDFDMTKAVIIKDIFLSEDKKSLILAVKDLPSASMLTVQIDNGVVKDISDNLFNKESSTINSLSFTTKPKQKQSLIFTALTEKVYGDPVFKLGPLYSFEGLPITYYAEDPTMLLITADSAKILKAGTTKVMAVQNGNEYYLPETVVQSVLIQPRLLVITPKPGQTMTYGCVPPEIEFDIISGSLIKDDKFTGGLTKAKGDTIGLYAITIGSLTLGNNYRIKLQATTIALQMASLIIRANDQTKIAGTPNPIFTCTYEGFVNGDSPAVLLKQPNLSCVSTKSSDIGSYPINITGAEAKNYAISYVPGKLKVVGSGVAEFEIKYIDLLENMPSGTAAGSLQRKKQCDHPLIFTLVAGDGDTDNDLFKITGNSILTTRPLDYEEKHQYSIRVKSAGAFGETEEKILHPLLRDVNESPQMIKIPFEAICTEGTIQLNGINAGPENNQMVKIFVKTIGLGSKNYFELTQPINGTSQLSYRIPYKQIKSVSIQIILKDDGGVLNGGIDSAVYYYTFKVVPKTVVHITSEKGLTLLRGTSSVLSTNATGKFQWYFNKQILKGEQRDYLKIKAEESGEYSVKVSNEGACISEAFINISVADSILVSGTNLISPNFDGINDSFILRNIEQYPENELWIMDRSGKLVYNQKSYSNNWQGTSNGALLPNGTYYYLLDLGNKKERLKGYVTVFYEQ